MKNRINDERRANDEKESARLEWWNGKDGINFEKKFNKTCGERCHIR